MSFVLGGLLSGAGAGIANAADTWAKFDMMMDGYAKRLEMDSTQRRDDVEWTQKFKDDHTRAQADRTTALAKTFADKRLGENTAALDSTVAEYDQLLAKGGEKGMTRDQYDAAMKGIGINRGLLAQTAEPTNEDLVTARVRMGLADPMDLKKLEDNAADRRDARERQDTRDAENKRYHDELIRQGDARLERGRGRTGNGDGKASTGIGGDTKVMIDGYLTQAKELEKDRVKVSDMMVHANGDVAKAKDLAKEANADVEAQITKARNSAAALYNSKSLTDKAESIAAQAKEAGGLAGVEILKKFSDSLYANYDSRIADQIMTPMQSLIEELNAQDRGDPKDKRDARDRGAYPPPPKQARRSILPGHTTNATSWNSVKG